MSLPRTLARSAYVGLARLLRSEDRLLDGIRRERRVVVLNLHRISPERNDFYPPLHPQALDALITFLKTRFVITGFAGLADVRRESPAAVLSFDDGFHDFVEYAMPVLTRHGISVNQNVIVSSALTGAPPWTQRVNDLLRAAPRSLLREIALPGFRMHPPDDQGDRARYGAALGAFLLRRPSAERVPLLAALDGLLARSDGPTTRMMDVADVREVARSHEIGAHSYAHDPMEHEDLDHFRQDVERCDSFFRDVLGRSFDIYAFPNGSYRPEQVEMLVDRGVRAVLLVGDRYAERRGPIYTRFNLGARDQHFLRLEALGFRARRVPL